LKNLYEQITPHYADDWKVIGVLLDLPPKELNAIAAKNPDNVKRCCNFMLEKWLETDTATKTWRQLIAVIDSPALSDSNPYSSKETVKGIVSIIAVYAGSLHS